MRIIILVLFLFLGGCGSLAQYCKDALITEKTVIIDPRSLAECKDLKTLPEGKVTFADVLANTTENAIVYAECRDNQHNSILLIKKFANIKE